MNNLNSESFILQAFAHLCLACRQTRLEGCPHQMRRHIHVHAGAVPNQAPSIAEGEHCNTIRTPAITPIQSRRLQNKWKACSLEGSSDNIVQFRMTEGATSTVSAGTAGGISSRQYFSHIYTDVPHKL